MTISATSFNKAPITSQPISQTQVNKQKSKPLPAVKMGLVSTALWGGLNFGVDKLFSKLLKYESKTSTSLIFSAIIGAIMGIITYNKANKINKQDTAAQNSLNKVA